MWSGRYPPSGVGDGGGRISSGGVGVGVGVGVRTDQVGYGWEGRPESAHVLSLGLQWTGAHAGDLGSKRKMGSLLKSRNGHWEELWSEPSKEVLRP